MASSITGFVEKFGGVKESLGVRLDIADCIKLFKTRKSICSLVKALRAIGVKFLNIGSVFSCVGGKRISSFAIDQNLLTPAVFGENFPIGESVDFALKFFNEREAQSMRAEFAKFCDKNAHWLDVYSLFSALSEQIGTHDFSKWPDILNVYVRRTAEIVKKQLQTSILSFKVIQFFAHRQMELIKSEANAAGIYLCGDCDILCEVLSAEVWENQRLFFVDDAARATVFAGLPPGEMCENGMKTSKVPYRVGGLKNSNYEFFDHIFSRCEELFDAIFLINGHAIFQHWEIACNDTDPKHGRWVCLPTDNFFEYMDSHFNNFPYLFDFNEPLFPNNEVILKRHNLLQAAIDGESTVHSCEIYDLSRELFAVSSAVCNRKIGKIPVPKDTRAALKSYFENCQKVPHRLCILHFDEICNSVKCSATDAINRPEEFAEKFLSFAGEWDWSPRKRSLSAEDGGADAEKEGQNDSAIQKFFNFLKKIFQ